MGVQIAIRHLESAFQFGKTGLPGPRQIGGELGAQGLVEQGIEDFHGAARPFRAGEGLT